MRIRSMERRRAFSRSRQPTQPQMAVPQVAGNAAAIQQMHQQVPAQVHTPNTSAPASTGTLTDGQQVARSELQAASATQQAQGMRGALDAKVATMQAQAAPHIRQNSTAFHRLRRELSPYLPQSIAPKSQIIEGMGFPRGETGGVPARTLRAPVDPDRPQLVAFAGEEGQEQLTEKLDGFKSARTQGEVGRVFGGLLQGKLDFDKEKATPAMSLLFDASGLDAGIAEAEEQMSGEGAKDMLAGVATGEALQKARTAKRLEKAVTGRGLGGRLAARMFAKGMPEARGRVQTEGAQSQAQVSAYVVQEAKSQLLKQKAVVEAQMVDNGLSLDKVALGALFSKAETHLEPNSLNLFMKTSEGKKFWLEDIGGASTYAEADKLESSTSVLHGKGELDNAALSRASMKQGLYPTAEGSFFRLPADLEPQRRAAATERMRSAYDQSKGQPIPAAVLRGIAQ